MYWHLGQRIFVEEQQGKERADYGTYLLQNLSKKLEPEFGSGFGYRQLKFCRQFYRTYPNGNTLRSQLNWSQYRRLIQIFAQEFIENVKMSVEMTGSDFDQELATSILEYMEDNGEVNAPEICSFQKTRSRITAYVGTAMR